MSDLSRFMTTARALLANDRPPVFVRTTWLFTEIDEALEKATQISVKLKVARLCHQDAIEASRLNAELALIIKQVAQLCTWANEQFQKG